MSNDFQFDLHYDRNFERQIFLKLKKMLFGRSHSQFGQMWHLHRTYSSASSFWRRSWIHCIAASIYFINSLTVRLRSLGFLRLTQKRKWMQNAHNNPNTSDWSEWLSLTKPTLAYEWFSLYWRVKITKFIACYHCWLFFVTSLIKSKSKSQRKVKRFI